MIEIEVVRLSPNAAKIGFTAPPQYQIHREEVLQRIEAEGDPSELCEAVPMDVAVYAVMQNAAVVWDPVSRTHIWKVMVQGKSIQGSNDEMCQQVKEALRNNHCTGRQRGLFGVMR